MRVILRRIWQASSCGAATAIRKLPEGAGSRPHLASVGAGFVESLARPGGNVTGFTPFLEFGISGKWLELLKEIAPRVTRAAVIRDPAVAAGVGQLGAIQSVAPSLGVELRPLGVRDAGEIERAITAFARFPNGGLIVTGSALATVHRDLIVTLAAQHKLPAVYHERYFAAAGGLISYGPDQIDQYRQAAGYVDRILKGEKPADLPVQASTKYKLVINLKTAEALGLEVPPTLLARAEGSNKGRPLCDCSQPLTAQTRSVDTHHQCRVTEVQRTLLQRPSTSIRFLQQVKSADTHPSDEAPETTAALKRTPHGASALAMGRRTMTGNGTGLLCWDVRGHGEPWRVSGREVSSLIHGR